MRTLIILVVVAGTVVPSLPQQKPVDFVPLSGSGNRAPTAPPVDSGASLYRGPHQASVAALKAAIDGLRKGRNLDHTLSLLLLAARRDPAFDTVLFDLGVICTREDRWDDAIQFYKRAQDLSASPELTKLTADEIERAQLIRSLEATDVGKRERKYDGELVKAYLLIDKDPATALVNSTLLEASDASRWEAYALAGVLAALADDFSRSAQELERASRVAPVDRRQGLTSALEAAKREAGWANAARDANAAWTQKDYKRAGRLWASAWESSPGHVDTGMHAAVAFLMADDISLAVKTLAILRARGAPAYAAKATAMLKELTPVSEEAARDITMQRIASAEGSGPDNLDLIRNDVGELLTGRIRLIAKTVPDLIEDHTIFTEMPDPELTAPDALYTSTESIYAVYLQSGGSRVAPALPVPSSPSPSSSSVLPTPESAGSVSPLAAVPRPPVEPDTSAVASTMPDMPANVTSRLVDVRPRATPATELVSPRTGADRLIQIVTSPAGARVVFDKDDSMACMTPCQIGLGSGRHTFIATLSGYRDILKILNVDRASVPLPVDLTFERKRAFVSVQTSAPGWRIYLDGEKTNAVTPATVPVAEGEHIIGVVPAAGSDKDMLKGTVRVTDGDMAKLTF